MKGVATALISRCADVVRYCGQKSTAMPFFSQSPNRVGSGPLRPPNSGAAVWAGFYAAAPQIRSVAVGLGKFFEELYPAQTGAAKDRASAGKDR